MAVGNFAKITQKLKVASTDEKKMEQMVSSTLN